MIGIYVICDSPVPCGWVSAEDSAARTRGAFLLERVNAVRDKWRGKACPMCGGRLAILRPTRVDSES